MAVAKHTITEYDIVEFRQQEGRWPAGTTGAVLIDHGDSTLVEISDADINGATLDLVEVPEPRLRLITDPDFKPKGYGGKLPLYGN